MDEDLSPEPILQLGMAFWGSKTLLSAVELGVFTALANGPKDETTIAQETGFAQTYVEHLLGPDSMVVGIK
jgi:hypothetical protein